MAKKTDTAASTAPMLRTAADVLIDAPGAAGAVPVLVMRKASLESDMAALTAPQRHWLQLSEFAAEPGQIARVPAADGSLAAVAFGAADDINDGGGALQMGLAAAALPSGDYSLASDAGNAALGWAMASYRFERYRGKKGKPGPRLVIMDKTMRERCIGIADSVWLARDLINTPAADMPDQVPHEIKEERNGRLLGLINERAEKKYEQFVGRRVQILVEGPSKKNAARLTGRTRCNKIVLFEGGERHRRQLLDVKIERLGSFTLYGTPAILNLD